MTCKESTEFPYILRSASPNVSILHITLYIYQSQEINIRTRLLTEGQPLFKCTTKIPFLPQDPIRKPCCIQQSSCLLSLLKSITFSQSCLIFHDFDTLKVYQSGIWKNVPCSSIWVCPLSSHDQTRVTDYGEEITQR